MNKIALALFALFALCASAAAQVVPPGTNPVPGAGAYNSSPPSCQPGQYCALQTDVNGQLKIAGTIAATLAGFTPGGTFATLTAAGTSGSVALPAGAVVAFQNSGTTTVSCTLGIGTATATANMIQVPASSTVFVTVGSNTFGACIDQTGSTSNLVVLAGGVGLGTGFGGGGGGSGGGGAITAASGSYASGALSSGSIASGAMAAGSHAAGAGVDGWDLTQGAKADAACAGGGSACSLNARLAHIEVLGGAPLPVQTGIGNVNIGAVQNAGSKYIAVAASQTATVLQTSTGAAGDYLSHCVIYPASTSPGVVTVFDNTNTAATSAILFAGGATSTSNLTPISVPVGALSTAGAWKVTTGASVSVVCYGKFS